MWLAIVHHLPDRTRLRCPSVRGDDRACAALADALAAVPGVREVKVRPYTASALVHHATTTVLADLTSTALQATGCDQVVPEGEAPPVDTQIPPLSSLAREAARAVHDLDRDIRVASAGVLDLGTTATLLFFGAGALEVAASRKLPMPPWFNLAWWGFRTFVTTEQEEIAAAATAEAPGAATPR